MEMESKIKKICKKIEREEKIRMIFCVESGSRAWNLESKDSDYDMRFVYVRPLKEYIQIHQRADVISKHYDKKGKPQQQQGCFLDFSGFDIFKFSKMLSVSNPTSIEWLRSPILYHGRIPKIWIDFAEKQFNPISLYHHYKSMCKQNYIKYLKSGNQVTYKKYLYAMRGLVNARWIAEQNSLPQIDFEVLLSILGFDTNGTILSPKIQTELYKIIDQKKQGNEKDIVKNQVKVDSYIEKFLKEERTDLIKRKSTLKELNKFLRRTVK